MNAKSAEASAFADMTEKKLNDRKWPTDQKIKALTTYLDTSLKFACDPGSRSSLSLTTFTKVIGQHYVGEGVSSSTIYRYARLAFTWMEQNCDGYTIERQGRSNYPVLVYTPAPRAEDSAYDLYVSTLDHYLKENPGVHPRRNLYHVVKPIQERFGLEGATHGVYLNRAVSSLCKLPEFRCDTTEGRKDIEYVFPPSPARHTCTFTITHDMGLSGAPAVAAPQYTYGPHFSSLLAENLISHDMLAKAADIDTELLESICRGHTRINPDVAIKLGAALPETMGVTAYDIYIAQAECEINDQQASA